MLFDIAGIDLNKVVFDQKVIREYNPQRGPMEHLNAIVYVDESRGRLIGFKDVGRNEFWVEGHIPGRPLLPGVLMIEAAAQLACFYTKKYIGWKGFVGFGGLEDCKFRQQVLPGARLHLIGQKIWERHRRVFCNVQGVVDGSIAFECGIIGQEF